MHTDTALTWVRRLCASLDAQFDAALPPVEDDVYTLVGLLRELDLALSSGARLPEAWSRSRPAAALFALPPLPPLPALGSQLVSAEPSNDTRRGRRRKVRARSVRSGGVAAQLCLPLGA